MSAGASSYDCDCGLSLNESSSYDCDCGLFVASSGSYDCDCSFFLNGATQPTMPKARGLWVSQYAGAPVALEGGWHAYWNPLGPVGVATLNPEAQRILAAFESPVSSEQAAERLSGMPAGEVCRAVRSFLA